MPAAAICLAVLMLGAAATHMRRREIPMIAPAAALCAMAILVAQGGSDRRRSDMHNHVTLLSGLRLQPGNEESHRALHQAGVRSAEATESRLAISK